jgi:hypothetical protein
VKRMEVGGEGGEVGAEGVEWRKFLAKLLHSPNIRGIERRFLWGLVDQSLAGRMVKLSPRQGEWLRSIAQRVGGKWLTEAKAKLAGMEVER